MLADGGCAAGAPGHDIRAPVEPAIFPILLEELPDHVVIFVRECEVAAAHLFETESANDTFNSIRDISFRTRNGDLLEGIVEPSEEVEGLLEDCLLCGYCQARCALNNLDIFALLRHRMAEEDLYASEHREKAIKILEEGRLFDRPAVLEREGTSPLYLCCLYQSKPVEVRTIISVLERCGIDPLVADETCCGYIVEATGFRAESESIQKRFMEMYGPYLDQEILTLCPTCAITLREGYGLNVKHAIVAVAERMEKLNPHQLNLKATYHDPCHLGRMLGLIEEPRAILRALGVELVEMEHNRVFSTCCGGGGGAGSAFRSSQLRQRWRASR